MSSYEAWCISVGVGSNGVIACFVAFTCWLLVRYPDVRNHVLQAAQDGDDVTNWVDGKNVVSLVLGLFNAWFTWDLMLIFVYHKMFDTGPAALVGLMVAITFTLLGIAWKKH